METAIQESDIASAYLDSDGSLYLFDKNKNVLEGWPKGWPEHIADVKTFCRTREIYLAV